MDHLINFTRRNTWGVILFAIIFSFIYPPLGIFLKPYLNYLLGTLMFLSCLDLQVQQIIDSFGDLKAQSLTLIIVHLVSPLIVFFIRDYFTPEIFLGLILATVLPAGRSAVFLCTIYGGLPIKALVVTSISNIFSPIVVPFLVWLFTHTIIKIDAVGMGTTIFWMVVIPLIIAYFFGKTGYGKKLNYFSPTISTFIVFLIILGIISPIKDVVIQNLGTTLILLLISCILITINFGLGFLLKKDLPGKITYGLSSSYKNYTLGTLLALSVFTPIVALPSIVYTIANNLMLIPFQLILNHQKHQPHHRQKYKNIFFTLIGIAITIFIATNQEIHQIIVQFGRFGYISAFFAGMLFASTFTVSIGAVILLNLSNILHPVALVFVAALGAVIIDSLIFKLFRHQVTSHTNQIFAKINHRSHLYKLIHTPYFSWSLSIIGILIMATPLPDELGISLLGLSALKATNFVAISYLSHTIGMTILILGASLF